MEDILVIDNYDSFTWNLIHYVEAITGRMPVVWRNDQVDLKACQAFRKIILSPGPGLPSESGSLMEIIHYCHQQSSILGICLGMQAIAEYFGAGLINLLNPFHGVSSKMTRTKVDDPLFNGIPQTFEAGRYHSWFVAFDLFPESLDITSKDDEGRCMSIQHKKLPVCGVQFHPESVLTPTGYKMIENFVNLY